MEQRISTTTASRLLRVSKSTIQRQIKAGNLKAEMQKVSQGGGNCGMSNMIPVSEVLQQLDTQGRLLWYESQSGLSSQNQTNNVSCSTFWRISHFCVQLRFGRCVFGARRVLKGIRSSACSGK